MEEYYVVIAKKTIQVSKDSWERHTKTLIVYPHTTLKEIYEWMHKHELDENRGCHIVKSENAGLGLPDYAKS